MSSLTTKQPNLNFEAQNLSDLLPIAERFVTESDIKPTSQKSYLSRLKQFFNWLLVTSRLMKLNQLIKQDILDYKRYLTSKELTPQTISGYLVVVRRFFNWLEAEKIYPDIAKEIKSPKKSLLHLKDALTGDQVREVLNSIDRTTAGGLRDYAIINLMARTGLRTCEIVSANLGDIRMNLGKQCLYIQGKGRDSKDNFVVLTPAAIAPINEYLAVRDKKKAKPTAPLFTSVSGRNYDGRLTTKSIRRLCKAAFVNVDLDSPTISAHSLRHTAITLAVGGGASLHQTQAMARHSDPRTTQVYFHNVERITRAAEDRIDF